MAMHDPLSFLLTLLTKDLIETRPKLVFLLSFSKLLALGDMLHGAPSACFVYTGRSRSVFHSPLIIRENHKALSSFFVIV